MLVALLILGGYLVIAALTGYWLFWKDAAMPDPSPAAIRVVEYLRKGRR
jgi:hypothetical protein